MVTLANSHTTLLDIARHFDLGYHEITAANPDVSVWLPKVGTRILIPTEFILPPGPREGIVVNIPQRRLFYYVKSAQGKPAQVVNEYPHRLPPASRAVATPFPYTGSANNALPPAQELRRMASTNRSVKRNAEGFWVFLSLGDDGAADPRE